MAGTADIEARLRVLEDIEAIKKLKAKYFRCLDSKLWDDLAECFADDAMTSYTDGQYCLKGREEIMKFLKAGLARTSLFGFHQGHTPEIDITGEDTARGVWSSHYYMINTRTNTTAHCGSFYHDEFIRQQGGWKISSTGYTRIFEEHWSREQACGVELAAVKDFSKA